MIHAQFPTMSLIKIPFIITGLLAADISFTPPHPPPKANEVSKFATKTDFMTRASAWEPMLLKVCLHRKICSCQADTYADR